MNSIGVGLILTVILFVLLAVAYRFAVRRAEKTGIGGAQGFTTGAIIANQSMFFLRGRDPKVGTQADEAELPPLPTQPQRDQRES
ncbi:MAG: hypothetical protein ACR2M3_02940 [Thermomicrobiales bacterium]